MLKLLNDFSNNSPLHVHLWSCYAGLASKEINQLAKGSVLITHGLSALPTIGNLHNFAFEQLADSFKLSPKIKSPFDIFAREFVVNSMQTSIVATSQNNKVFRFEINPDLNEFISNPEDIVSGIRNEFEKFYLGLQKNLTPYLNQDIATYKFSKQEVDKFLIGFFIHSCHIGSAEILEILEAKADNNDRQTKLITESVDGATALYASASMGRLEAVKKLLEHNADVNKASNQGSTPLCTASTSGHLAVVGALLEHGADVDKADKDGITPLYASAAKGHSIVAKKLLEHGADVNKANNNGATPISVSAQNGHLEVVKILLKYGADVDKAGTEGDTPLYIASQEGRLEIVKTFLEHGADVNKATKDKVTPLNMASQEGHLEVVKMLLAHGADVNKANNNGATPLYLASREGHLEIVKILLEHNADVNKAKSDGNTPLFQATLENQQEVVKTLLEHGADVNKAKSNGATPIFAAVCLKHPDIVKLLLEYQGDLYTTVKGKLNSLDVIKKHCPENVYILEQAQKKLAAELQNKKLNNFDNQGEDYDLSNPLIQAIDNHDEL